jgi:hypothetical protein
MNSKELAKNANIANISTVCRKVLGVTPDCIFIEKKQDEDLFLKIKKPSGSSYAQIANWLSYMSERYGDKNYHREGEGIWQEIYYKFRLSDIYRAYEDGIAL